MLLFSKFVNLKNYISIFVVFLFALDCLYDRLSFQILL